MMKKVSGASHKQHEGWEPGLVLRNWVGSKKSA